MDNMKTLLNGALGLQVPAEFAVENYDYEAALRDELKKVAGTRSLFRRNMNDIFDLLAETLDEMETEELYEALEKALAAQGILNLNACIVFPENEDEYLTRDSVKFHEKMGFETAGRFHKCGCKFGRWYDIVWMEKHIGTHEENPAEVRSFAEVMKGIF